MMSKMQNLPSKLSLPRSSPKLKEAEQIAKTARAWADVGSISIRVSTDLDQHVYDVGRLQ